MKESTTANCATEHYVQQTGHDIRDLRRVAQVKDIDSFGNAFPSCVLFSFWFRYSFKSQLSTVAGGVYHIVATWIDGSHVPESHVDESNPESGLIKSQAIHVSN
jgi:hypothetical protein